MKTEVKIDLFEDHFKVSCKIIPLCSLSACLFAFARYQLAYSNKFTFKNFLKVINIKLRRLKFKEMNKFCSLFNEVS